MAVPTAKIAIISLRNGSSPSAVVTSEASIIWIGSAKCYCSCQRDDNVTLQDFPGDVDPPFTVASVKPDIGRANGDCRGAWFGTETNGDSGLRCGGGCEAVDSVNFI
jgi:hypothetical protein